MVQELARKGFKRLPERFIRLPPDQPIAPATTLVDHVQETLSIIDVLELKFGSEPEGRGQEVARLASCAKDWGMFLITNHGISNSLLDGVRDVVKDFFGLSFEKKKASVGSYMSVDNMGYGRNFVKSEDQPLDWIDRLTMVAAPADQQLQLVWPQQPPNFRLVMERYVDEARKVCDDLLQALAEALSLHTHVFLHQFEPNKSELKLRINYYPPCPRPDLAMGLCPHSDASGLTLLMQFEASECLQVLKDERWITVPWPPDTLLVNFGDFMEIMSNGRFISPWHRVLVTQSNVERFSVAVFYNPPPDADIEPIQDEKEDSGKRRYKKVVVSEYLQQFYKLSPTPTKQAILFAMV